MGDQGRRIDCRWIATNTAARCGRKQKSLAVQGGLENNLGADRGKPGRRLLTAVIYFIGRQHIGISDLRRP